VSRSCFAMDQYVYAIEKCGRLAPSGSAPYSTGMNDAKEGRGRPRKTEARVAYETRVSPGEAAAFDELVRRKGIAAAGAPDALSSAAVLRGLMRIACEEAGISLVEPALGTPARPISNDAEATEYPRQGGKARGKSTKR
jgi:hypothetical protein